MASMQQNDMPESGDVNAETIALFQYTIEQSPQAVFWLDRNGRFSYVNKQACDSLGYTREELLNLYLWEIDPDFPKERWDPHWREMRNVRKKSFETIHRRKDGHIFPIQVTAYQVNYKSKEFHAAFVNDITELKQAREEQVKLSEQLHQAQKLEAIGTLTGGIAHDFNNMLSVILGYSELLKVKIEDRVSMKEILEIENAALRSRDIIRQLLAFSRKQVIAPISLDVNHQINNTIKMVGRLIGEQIELQLDTEKAIWKIKLDPYQLDQILINLVVNSRDSMPDGGKLRIMTSNCFLDDDSPPVNKETPPGEYVLLSVCDTGTGMDKETLSQVFDPFFTTKEQGKGTGLGLATIYGIIKQNDGIIDVQSVVGQGTTFNIYFPVFKDERETEDSTDLSPMKNGTGKILLVEDDDMVREVVSKMLEAIGYDVLSLSDPLAAISYCESGDAAIDLLFTDIVMPKMDGMDLSEKIKGLNPGIKVLFMSGYSPEISSRKGILPKGMHFIEKPFGKKDLALKIEAILT